MNDELVRDSNEAPTPDGAVRDGRLDHMSPDELSASMRRLGCRTQADMAASIGVSRSSISLWLDGKIGVPRPIAMLIRLLVEAQRRNY